MKKLYLLLLIVVGVISCNDKSENNIGAFNTSRSITNGFTSSDKIVEETIVEVNEKIKNVTRKLIKNGNISFETNNLQETKSNITQLVQKYNGYISSDNQNNYGDRKSINLNIRIPAKYFDSILNNISKNVNKFDQKNIRISDVTEEFLDVEARLKNKKELEKKYLDILTKAKSVKEILQVEKELGKLREDIESVEGRLKYLQNQVAFSTLSINFYKTQISSTSFGSRISKGFSNGFENLKSFFVGIINIWPFLIIVILLVFLFRKWRKNRRKS